MTLMNHPHEDDPVARNRAANPRRTPGRVPTGDHIMPALWLTTCATIIIATVVLVAVLLS